MKQGRFAELLDISMGINLSRSSSAYLTNQYTPVTKQSFSALHNGQIPKVEPVFFDKSLPSKQILQNQDMLLNNQSHEIQSVLLANTNSDTPLIPASTIFRLRVAESHPQVMARYVYWFLQTNLFKKQLSTKLRSTTMQFFSIKDLGSIIMPIPPPDEQNLIITLHSLQSQYVHKVEKLAMLQKSIINTYTQQIEEILT